MDCNLLLMSDSYKMSHHKQYPPNTEYVYSYFESRGGKFPYTVFFGLQYIIKKYLVGEVVTREKIQEAKELSQSHFGRTDLFNEEGWNYIVEHHQGRLPVRIKAVAEGSVVPVKNVLFTVENTDPRAFWLTGFLETLLVQAWYPMTVATNSRIQKQICASYLRSTGSDMAALAFMLHDFGARGCTSMEAAAIGGAAHLVNFQGTDTIAAVRMLRQFYHCPCAGHSIPATEHSTITAWGRNGEAKAYENMMVAFPTGVIACVSDSYDIYASIEKLWGQQLREAVMERGANGGRLVVRPDSGDPVTVVLKCLELMENAFGTSRTEAGYKLLPPYIRLIQGDGINYSVLFKILVAAKRAGWAAENVSFGSGGALLQKVDRDTQKCAYKCSSVVVDGRQTDVFKDPVTDPGKKSKRGHLQLHRGPWKTLEEGQGDVAKDQLQTVFLNGALVVDQDLAAIRERAQLTDDDYDVMAWLATQQ